jgi:hypothetical protein
MRSLYFPFALAFGGACLFSACFFPEITYLGNDASGGAAGMVATGGLGGVGGDPTTTTMGGGGSGGSALMCEVANLGVTGLCGSGQKCTVTDATAGEVGCALAGPKADWETCVDDADCLDGSWCDLQGSVCKPFCQNAAACSASSGECLRAKQAGSMPEDIPNNVKTCISMCSPLTAVPCGMQSVTCAFIGNNQFDCVQSANQTIGTSCSEQSDCARTLGCIDSLGLQCEQFCSPIGSGHANCSFFSCASIDTPSVTWMGMEIGTCF